MKQALIATLLVACGAKEVTGVKSTKVAPETSSPAISLANGAHASSRPVSNFMVYLGDKLVSVDRADVQGDPEASFRGFDDHGRLAPASGTWRPARTDRDVPPPEIAATAVLVDRDVPAAKLRAALAPLADRCIGFLVKHDGAIASLIPDPCPSKPAVGEDTVQLAALIDKDKIMLGVSRVDEIEQLADKAALEAALEEKKASAFFADRTDMVFAFHDDVTSGEVIEILDIAYGAGFTGATWVELPQLPLDLSHGPSAAHDSKSPAPAGPTISIGQPNLVGDLDKKAVRRAIHDNGAKLLVCYKKRLAITKGLAGTVNATFFIGPDGRVASSTASGVEPDLASCVAGVIQAIEFPKTKDGGGVQVNYPFTFRSGD